MAMKKGSSVLMVRTPQGTTREEQAAHDDVSEALVPVPIRVRKRMWQFVLASGRGDEVVDGFVRGALHEPLSWNLPIAESGPVW